MEEEVEGVEEEVEGVEEEEGEDGMKDEGGGRGARRRGS